MLDLAAFTYPPSSRWLGARCVEREPGDDLVGEGVGEILERGLLCGDGRIFGTDDVDAGVRARSRVEHHHAGRSVDQLIARPKCAPLVRRGAVAADAERGDIVVERDV